MNEATNQHLLQQQPPDPFCGICSTERCRHGLCRGCGGCQTCERPESSPLTPASTLPVNVTVEAPLRKKPFTSVRLAPLAVSTVARQVAIRASYLESIAIGWKDMADASRAMDELISDCCVCGNRKRTKKSFCERCFNLIPCDLKPKLALHLEGGYLPYIRQAWCYLASLRVGEGKQPS